MSTSQPISLLPPPNCQPLNSIKCYTYTFNTPHHTYDFNNFFLISKFIFDINIFSSGRKLFQPAVFWTWHPPCYVYPIKEVTSTTFSPTILTSILLVATFLLLFITLVLNLTIFNSYFFSMAIPVNVFLFFLRQNHNSKPKSYNSPTVIFH